MTRTAEGWEYVIRRPLGEWPGRDHSRISRWPQHPFKVLIWGSFIAYPQIYSSRDALANCLGLRAYSGPAGPLCCTNTADPTFRLYLLPDNITDFFSPRASFSSCHSCRLGQSRGRPSSRSPSAGAVGLES